MADQDTRPRAAGPAPPPAPGPGDPEGAPQALKDALIAALAEAVRRRGLTQTEAARLCRTDQPTFSKVLRGRLTGVSLDKLVAWLSALGGSVRLTAVPPATLQPASTPPRRRWEDRVREAHAAAQTGIYEMDLRSGAVTWSAEMFRLYAIPPDTPPGRLFDAWVATLHPDDRDWCAQAVRTCTAREGPVQMEFRAVLPGGQIRWVQGRGIVERGPDGTPLRLHGINFDVTEHRRAEQALRESEERYRVLAAATREGVVLHREEHIVEANEAFWRMFGYPGRDAVIGQPIMRFVAPEARAATLARYRSGVTVPYESTGIRADGSAFPVAFTGGPALYQGQPTRVVVVRDLSEVKAAEAATRATEARLAAVLRHMPVGVLIAESPGRRLIHANAEAERILGRAFSPESTAQDWPLADAMAEGKAVADRDIPVVRPDGERRVISARAAPILDADGKRMAGVVAFTDVTATHSAGERDRFLAWLAAALRDLSDPLAVLDAGAALVGRFLQVQRASFAELSPDEAEAVIRNDWTDGLPSIAGRHSLAQLGAGVLEELRAGRTVVTADTSCRSGSHAEALHRLGIRATVTAPVLRNGAWVAALAVHAAAPRRWTEEDVAVIEQAASQIWNALERARAETSLRESEQRLRATYEQSGASISETDAGARFLRVNEAACQMTGYAREELIGRSFLSLGEGADDEADRNLYARLVAGRIGAYELEKRVRRKDGRAIWVSVAASAVRDAAGLFLHGIRVTHDVTERRQAQARQKLLLDELNHRVKNTLATVQSIATQTALRHRTPEAFRDAFEARLQALAQTHDLLTRGNWEGTALHDILAQEFAPYMGAGERRVQMAGPAVQLGPRAALTLALVLHELATNAAKYGALSVPFGRIELFWRTERMAAGGRAAERLEMLWQEGGGPPVERPARRGFGTRLLQAGIGGDLEGETDIDFDPAGLRCRITFPLSGQSV